MSLVVCLMLSLVAHADEADAAPDTDAADAAEVVEAPAAEEVAEAPPEHEPALKAPVMWSLEDGTQVVFVEDHRVPLVELRIQLSAGNWTPWFRANGGSEAFYNTFYDPEGSLRTRADNLAASFHFSIKNQRSIVMVSCLKRDLPAVVELLGDVLSNTAYDPDELKRDQKNRQLGWKSSLKDPNFRSQQAAHALLFAEGDVRRQGYDEPLDVVQDLDQLVATRDTLLRLPGRALGFGGDLSREEAEALAVELLPPVSEAVPEDMEPVVLELLDPPDTATEPMENLTQVYLSWFREGLTWDHPDYARWLVANHALGGHFYSRLYVALRHEGGETYGVRAQLAGASEPRLYGLSTFTRTENIDTIEAKLRKTVETMRTEGITAEELEAAKGSMRGKLLFGQQSPGQVLNEALWELGNDREPGFDESVVEDVEALSLEEVNSFIEGFYEPSKFTMLITEPAE